MSGVHKNPTISFRISEHEREEIEAKIVVSDLNKIEEFAKEKGIKKKTLFNAKREMNIDSVKIGNQWY